MGERKQFVEFAEAQVLRLLRHGHGSEIPAHARLELDTVRGLFVVRWDKVLPVDDPAAVEPVAKVADPSV